MRDYYISSSQLENILERLMTDKGLDKNCFQEKCNSLAQHFVRSERPDLLAKIIDHVNVDAFGGNLLLSCLHSTDCLTLMVKKEIPPALLELALVQATKKAYLNAVKILVRISPQDACTNALFHSIDMSEMNNEQQMVFLCLLHWGDPKDNSSAILNRAIARNNGFAAEHLQPLSNVDEAIIDKHSVFPKDSVVLQDVLQRRNFQQKLNCAVKKSQSTGKIGRKI